MTEDPFDELIQQFGNVDAHYPIYRRMVSREALIKERFTQEFGEERLEFVDGWTQATVFDTPTTPFGYNVPNEGPIAYSPGLIAAQSQYLDDGDFRLYMDVLVEIIRELLQLREDVDRSAWDKLELVNDILRHASIRGYYLRQTVEQRGLTGFFEHPYYGPTTQEAE